MISALRLETRAVAAIRDALLFIDARFVQVEFTKRPGQIIVRILPGAKEVAKNERHA